MRDYQKLLDNGWIVQISKSDNGYLALGLNQRARQIVTAVWEGREDISAVPMPFCEGETPEQALFLLTERVLFGR